MGATLVITSTAAVWLIDRPQSEGEAVVDDFVAALNARDVQAAANLTSYPNAAAVGIAQMFDGLSGGNDSNGDFEVSQFIGLDGSSGFFTLDSDWNFGDGKDWGYSTRGTAKKLSVGWRIAWEPDVLAPDLPNGGTVRYVRTDAPPPLVFDSSQNVLMQERTINAILLDPSRMPDPVASTTRVADVISVVAPLITAQSLQGELASSAGAPVLAVNLRDDDFAVLEDDLRAIDGVVVTPTPKLIAGDRRITSPLLGALSGAWQDNRDATAGWAVDVTGPDGLVTRQIGYQGPQGPDLHATLDPRIQLAAEEAVVSVGTSASIVAIVPSTGAIVAASQNSYANEQGPVAFSGMYPAGSLTDLLTVDGVDPTQLGLGVSYSMPGLDAHTGRLPSGNNDIDRFRNVGNNASELAVSPFGLAQVSAAIARGSAPVPSIVAGQPAVADRAVDPISSDALARLRERVQGAPTSQGLTGFAGNSGDDRWFLGSRGDLAFAVYIENADGTDQAMKMASRLLTEMDTATTQ